MPILTRTHDRIVADYECAIDNLERECARERARADGNGRVVIDMIRQRDEAREALYRNADTDGAYMNELTDRIRDLELERDSAIRHAQHTFADTLRMHHERDEAIGCHDAAAAMVQSALDENDELRAIIADFQRELEHAVTAAVVVTASVFAVDQLGETTIVGTPWAADFAEAVA